MPEGTSNETMPMPIWLDESHISPEWIKEVTNLPCTSCAVVDISNETRKGGDRAKDGATLRLSLQSKTTGGVPKDKTLIIKQAPEQGRALSKQLGLAREALFYQHFSSNLPPESTPKIYYSYGNFETGEKCIIMEDVQNAVDSGILFGPGNPNNWNRDLPDLISKTGWNDGKSPPPSSREVALATFREIAKIHAVFWKNDNELLNSDKTWLRGQEWLQGKGRDNWEASQKLVRTFWNSYLEAEKKSDEPSIQWDANVRKAVEKAVAGISWEAQLKRLNVGGHYTLVHGDFWPGNVLWMTEESNKIKLLDWEMVGLGSGPQDLGQYVISNMDPAERKECERELIEAYHQELRRKHSIDCSFEYCWREYQVGGVERWLWFLVYFLGNGMTEWAQFFHNQISPFMTDHDLTADDITQPRP